jgi:hypothetical protein
MTIIVVMIHMAKANQYGDVADNRGLAHHRNLLEDPLLLMAIHCSFRLFLKQGKPLPELYLQSDEWYAPSHKIRSMLLMCIT